MTDDPKILAALEAEQLLGSPPPARPRPKTKMEALQALVDLLASEVRP